MSRSPQWNVIPWKERWLISATWYYLVCIARWHVQLTPWYVSSEWQWTISLNEPRCRILFSPLRLYRRHELISCFMLPFFSRSLLLMLLDYRCSNILSPCRVKGVSASAWLHRQINMYCSTRLNKTTVNLIDRSCIMCNKLYELEFSQYFFFFLITSNQHFKDGTASLATACSCTSRPWVSLSVPENLYLFI